MKHMSFALTTAQIRNRTKTVTRRMGWATAKRGDVVQPIVKGQGLRKGEHVERIGDPIRFVSVRREPLNRCSHEMAEEGFPLMTAEAFIAMFCMQNGCTPDTIITRIEFEYV
jgi:hypothetical protein